MPPFKVSIKHNTKEIADLFRRLERSMADTTTVMEKSADIMHSDIIQHFADKTDSEGHPWAPVRNDPGRGDILQRSGRLRMSFYRHADSRNAYVSNNVEYAAAQNFGMRLFIKPRLKPFLAWKTSEGWAFSRGHEINIPPREFLYISENGMERIEKAFTNAIDNAIG